MAGLGFAGGVVQRDFVYLCALSIDPEKIKFPGRGVSQ
jgi:hypothetical protein